MISKFKLVLGMITIFTSTLTFAGSSLPSQTLPTVSEVSLERYSGQWYAITALPQFFTRKCVVQEAVYTFRSSTQIGVENICIKRSGKRTSLFGYAKTTDISGMLKLRFTSGIPGLFRVKGDYNIIKLDPEYKYSLIGGKDRKSLWLLARTKEIDEAAYNEYVEAAHELGYDISRLVDSKF